MGSSLVWCLRHTKVQVVSLHTRLKTRTTVNILCKVSVASNSVPGISMCNRSSSIATMSNRGSGNSRSSCISTMSNSNWGGSNSWSRMGNSYWDLSNSMDRGSNSLGDSLYGVSTSLVDNWLVNS